MPTININNVADNAKVYVTGIVDYSHITSQIDGEELAADDARKIANGMRAVGKPHARISISKAAVTHVDASAPNIAEQYIGEKLYVSKARPEKDLCYTGVNKSKKLPDVFCRENAMTTTVEPVALQGEIAQGSNVTLILRFFSTNQNKGVSLDAIIVNEKPVRCASNKGSMSLTGTNFTVVPATEGNVDMIREQIAVQPAVAAAPTPTPVAATYAQPAPAPVAPVSQPAPVVPAQTAVAPAPAPSLPIPPKAAELLESLLLQQPAPAPSLPIPPKGYTYDAEGRIVPEAAVAGIKLP